MKERLYDKTTGLFLPVGISGKLGDSVFSFRVPADVEEKLLKEDGRPDNILVRKIVLMAIAEHPEWTDKDYL